MVEKPSFSKVSFNPNYLPLDYDANLISKAMQKAKEKNQWVLVFVIGTKPCYYKFYGSIVEAERQDIPYIIINSNQHYDSVLTQGSIELDYLNRTSVNLNIRGDLAQKSAELFTKIDWFAKYLKKEWPSVPALPVVLGDTIMCGIVPAAWMFSRGEKAIHNEAGLRAMTPRSMKNALSLSPKEFVESQFTQDWELLTSEPFPEQWDSFVGSKASEYLFAPLNLNKEHLIREGHPSRKIFVTGGVVIEAFDKRMKEKPSKSIFSLYPVLREGKWIRVDIHRKENQSESRFKSIISCISGLVDEGYNVCFVEMNTSKESIDKYGLRQKIEELKQKKNFLHTLVWPEYSQVLEFYSSDNCLAALTDSGGVQEEMNLLGKPCLTVRYSTDRPETVKDAHSNVLIPPINGSFMVETIKYILSNKELMNSFSVCPRIYERGVARKFISTLKEVMSKGSPFEWADDELGLSVK